jgi:hypothetical protein
MVIPFNMPMLVATILFNNGITGILNQVWALSGAWVFAVGAMMGTVWKTALYMIHGATTCIFMEWSSP